MQDGAVPGLGLTWLLLASSLSMSRASAAARAKTRFLCTVVLSLWGTLWGESAEGLGLPVPTVAVAETRRPCRLQRPFLLPP